MKRRPLWHVASVLIAQPFFLILFLLLFVPATLAAPPAAAIASAHPLATRAGLEILADGGNAFDAAITVSAVLAVVEPYSSGLGGGGFWLLHREADNKQVMIDGRETAPSAAHRDMYLDKHGKPIPKLSLDGALAAGIPGEPAALAHLAKHYGRLPLSRTLAAAIRYAEEGFKVDRRYRDMARARLKLLNRYPSSAQIFLYHGRAPRKGHVILQPELGRVLRAIAQQGHDGFYKGSVAKDLVKKVRSAGGIWSLKDLADYQVVEREPVRGTYHGIRVTSAAPPSSGGIGLMTMLNILSRDKLEQLDSTLRTHLIIEAMRRAYRDRAEYLGDPDFVSIPQQRLIHPMYGEGLRASVRPDRATPSAQLPGFEKEEEGTDTSHFSILDREGNRVAATVTVNYVFGSGFTAAGVLLNNEMDDFSIKPGVPNVYGLVGAEANAIAPGKRPLSSMTPTFLESTRGVAILGTPGGSRIITMVLNAVLDFAAGNDPLSWVSKPRFHHQFLPDEVQYEKGAFTPTVKEDLARMGHHLRSRERTYGNMQAVFWDQQKKQVKAASDPRGVGLAHIQ